MTAIDVTIGQWRLTAEIEDQPPLGWRERGERRRVF